MTISASYTDIPFPPYEQHGVRVSVDAQKRILTIKDTSNPSGIQGFTTFDRHPILFDDLLLIASFLQSRNNRPAESLFVPCSNGMEPISFAKKAHQKGFLSSHFRIRSFDINAAFMACAREYKYPSIILPSLNRDWREYLRMRDGYLKPIDALKDMVSFDPAQDFHDHSDQHDMITILHLLYYFDAEEHEHFLKRAFRLSRCVVAIDHSSYMENPAVISEIMAAEGFAILNQHCKGQSSKRVYWPDAKEDIIFCRKEFVEEIAENLSFSFSPKPGQAAMYLLG